jgi:hypothetical protein
MLPRVRQAYVNLFSWPKRDNETIDTTLLLAICTWFIFNSHLEAFYPYKWLAADGLLANSLFYLLSGFAIQKSLRYDSRGFYAYAIRRMLRIYPAILTVGTIFLFFGVYGKVELDFLHMISYFVWPTPYTYVKHIVVYYIILYFVARGSKVFHFGLLVVALLVSAFAIGWHLWAVGADYRLSLGALPATIWWPYFFALVLGGAFIARSRNIAGSYWLDALLIVMFFAYFVIKFAILVLGLSSYVYPALFLFVFLICILALTSHALREFSSWIYTRAPLKQFVAMSANLSFQIYIVHQGLVYFQVLQEILFPFNIILLSIISLLQAIAVYLFIAVTNIERKFVADKRS